MSNTVKIYGITCYQAPQMYATGNRFSVEPWGKNTTEYKGEDDGGADYILPEGYHVAEDGTGTKHIYPANENFPCDLVVGEHGNPVITAVTYPGYITLKKAE